MSDPQRLVGQTLRDTYRIESLLGEGSMGAVYEASHLRLGRRFAIKIIGPSVAGNATALKRFQREARITSSLGHPNIVQVFEFYQPPRGRPYLVMEYLEGEDLDGRLAREPRLELAEIDALLIQMASALDAVHEKGIVHRDLKPSNFFLCPSSEGTHLKVLDFGISKVLGSENTQLTAANTIVGTPYYMAPEQVAGGPSDVDARADVYAVGAILFEMLAGAPPFADKAVIQVLYNVLERPAPPLRSVRPDLSPAIDAIVARSLAKDKAKRFATVGELARAFSGAAGVDEEKTRPIAITPFAPAQGRRASADPDRTLPPEPMIAVAGVAISPPPAAQPEVGAGPGVVVKLGETEPELTQPGESDPRAALHVRQTRLVTRPLELPAQGSGDQTAETSIWGQEPGPDTTVDALVPGETTQNTGAPRWSALRVGVVTMLVLGFGLAIFFGVRAYVATVGNRAPEATAPAVAAAVDSTVAKVPARPSDLDAGAAADAGLAASHADEEADAAATAAARADSAAPARPATGIMPLTAGPRAQLRVNARPRGRRPTRKRVTSARVAPRPPPTPRKRAVAEGATGTLVVVTKDDRGLRQVPIRIDGRLFGLSAPLQGIELSAGRHVVVVDQRGFGLERRAVRIKPGRATRLIIPLRRQ